MPTSRTVTICVLLFLSSALISISLRRLPSSSALRSIPDIQNNFAHAYQEYRPPKASSSSPSKQSAEDSFKKGLNSAGQQKYAFATFLAGTEADEIASSKAVAIDGDQSLTPSTEANTGARGHGHEAEQGLRSIRENDDEGYGYYLGARIIVYSLLHHPSTRSGQQRSSNFYARSVNASRHDDASLSQQSKLGDVPVLVLHTPSVPEYQLRRLERDGATLVPTPPLAANWVSEGLGSARWNAVLAKLRLWEMEGWDKICFIDSDTLITAPLDGVFDDPATNPQMTRRSINDNNTDVLWLPDEDPTPSTYLFASKVEAWAYEHRIPPLPLPAVPKPRALSTPAPPLGEDEPDPPYTNVGFFVMRPSRELFSHYMSILRSPGKFEPRFPEQNLLNYAHRRDGAMPWSRLDWKWNMGFPTMKDFEGGARSFHAKYWDQDEGHDPQLKRIWEDQVREMHGFYHGRDAAEVRLKAQGIAADQSIASSADNSTAR